MDALIEEAGGHRIQRIPPGERRGRVHSSTVTIAVLDSQQQASQCYRQTNPEDFEISFYSGTGPGGQNRNKVQASARIVHKHTGITRTSQTRSRENSVRLAMEAIMQDLAAYEKQEIANQVGVERKQQVGTGQRGDKRRTYRTQEDQVHDHISGKTARMSDVMKGNPNLLWK